MQKAYNRNVSMHIRSQTCTHKFCTLHNVLTLISTHHRPIAIVYRTLGVVDNYHRSVVDMALG